MCLVQLWQVLAGYILSAFISNLLGEVNCVLHMCGHWSFLVGGLFRISKTVMGLGPKADNILLGWTGT